MLLEGKASAYLKDKIDDLNQKIEDHLKAIKDQKMFERSLRRKIDELEKEKELIKQQCDEEIKKVRK